MTIPPEAVEAACRAWLAKNDKEYGFGSKWPDDFEDDEKEMMRRLMLAALNAAAPFIRAQVVEDCVKVADQQADTDRLLNIDNDYKLIAVGTAKQISKSIRALIPAETKET